ncbi:uncharacterized protein FPRO_04651 [Fusarium proliferatum ET1]|uniref:Uncharacterized protein n=1 Tax=Fusarium proliferatum (strain ET1) TaxID=1227346 RepID=A0A1L7VH84_FUSPR|nr:uncharacterized protein FPRO_04651 [Fusarium proliferatum ET1]CZR39754.1 uncharacterized protein FPRO_04651 [Fusarium proliferatum ET1]
MATKGAKPKLIAYLMFLLGLVAIGTGYYMALIIRGNLAHQKKGCFCVSLQMLAVVRTTCLTSIPTPSAFSCMTESDDQLKRSGQQSCLIWHGTHNTRVCNHATLTGKTPRMKNIASIAMSLIDDLDILSRQQMITAVLSLHLRRTGRNDTW